jgi:hypothetical protein
LRFADFNQDGKQDIAIANADSSTVSIRLGDGSGGFSGLTEVSALVVLRCLWPSEISNNDGRQDIAVANLSTLAIRLGDGSGGFNSIPDVGVGTFSHVGRDWRIQ